MSCELELLPEGAGLCIVDVQQKLAGVMPEKVLKATLRNCLTLIETARVFELPTSISEQYPRGLGRTLPVIAEAVLRLPHDKVLLFEKLELSCGGHQPFAEWLAASGRRQWIVVGMEAHVCIYQTARWMCEAGLTVHVPRDAVISRTMSNWETGLKLIERAGAIVTSTETVMFDLLKRAGTEQFKALSRLIKD